MNRQNQRTKRFAEVTVIEADGSGGSLVSKPRALEISMSDFMLDNGESAFDKREYLNAGGKKKKKKVKKVKKKKKVKTKDGLIKDILVETEQIQNEDGTPLTKDEVAQNKAKENAAVTTELKAQKIDPKNVSEVKDEKADDKEEEGGKESKSADKATDAPKPELVFGMPKTVAYGGAAVIGVLFVVGIVLVLKKGKKAEPTT